MNRRLPAVLLVLLASMPALVSAQDGYRDPPAPIVAMLDARPTPGISLSPRRDWFVLLDRPGLPPIAEVAAPHLKLAGSRIDPITNGPAGAGGYDGFVLQRVKDGGQRRVEVPGAGRLSAPSWAPDGRHFLFTHTSEEGIGLWVADTNGKVQRLTDPVLNGTSGTPCRWLDGGTKILCARIPASRGERPDPPRAPSGPATQETRGRAAPERTYQDLLASPYDEELFAHYFTRQWVIVGLDGAETPVGPPGLTVSLSPSPDGEWFIAETVQRPFSYQVTWDRFPSRTALWDRQGREVRLLRNVTQVEVQSIARGAVTPGARAWRWRGDVPATLLWTEALDNGDPSVAAARRDRLLALDAPFQGEPRTWFEVAGRVGGIWWGRADLALVGESWAPERRSRTWIVDPRNPTGTARLLWDRASDDRYGDPGSPLQATDTLGNTALQFSRDGKALWLTGAGASPEGDRPFIDRLELASGKAQRLWQSSGEAYESMVAAVDADAGTFITRRETATEPPNYWLRDVIRRRAPIQLTRIADPAPEFAGVTSQFLTYHRADGITLSGTLYLPKGYDRRRDGPLPFLFWVYPAEFQSADAASQVRGSPYRFTRPGGASHLFLLTQGYGILDNPSFPIIGAGETANDTYVEQLISSATAAIDTLVAMGVADRDRIAVGGHSYGAFTTANLLAHTRLFRAGIARSGAYNRSLTPFGFQSERRTYWEAEPVYRRMSPFTYADSLKDPILFIHGMDDNNSGTFPIQSERMYAAVKGFGGTARLVMLPGEAHGYSARESVGQTLAEMTDWLDRYVKPKRGMVP